MEFIEAKTIVTRRKNTKNSEWFGTEYNMNIYKGCCHGCIYCDSRSECYGIEDFNTVRAKKDALQIIRDELRRKVRKGVIATGAMSDPYNPFEKKYNLTGNALELINAFGFGVAIDTKSSLILRDTEIIKDISSHSPVCLKITITSCDDSVSKIIEPGVCLSSERFDTISRLSDKGIFIGILLMPVIPFIEDTVENITKIVNTAYNCGAKFIYPSFGITLRDRQRNHFYEKLDIHYSGLKDKFIKTYHNNYYCASPRANELYKVFKKECDKYGLLYNMRDIVRAYKLGYESEQLTLF